MARSGDTARRAQRSRSLWIRLETGWTLAGALLLCAVIASLRDLAACAIALFIGLLLLIAAFPPPDRCLRRFAAINLFVICMWLIVPWTTPGESIWSWQRFAITSQGIQLCALLSLKANAILAVFLAFLGQTSTLGLARALVSLHCPDKLTWILLLMERNIHLLSREWRKMLDAAKLRGFAARASKHGYRTLAVLLGLLFIRAQERGQKLNEALLLAGFSGKLPFRPHLHFALPEAGFCLLVAAISALLLMIGHA